MIKTTAQPTQSPGAVARSQRGVRSPTLLELQSDLRSARRVLEGLERQAEIAGNRMDTVTAMQLLKRARPVRAEVKLLSEAVAAIEALGYEGVLFDTQVTR